VNFWGKSGRGQTDEHGATQRRLGVGLEEGPHGGNSLLPTSTYHCDRLISENAPR